MSASAQSENRLPSAGQPAADRPAGSAAAAIRGAKRWYWQRISAMAMALFVAVHLVVMIVAIRGGLTAAEILGRTRGSLAWGAFYGLFVALVAVHGSIGLRNVLAESTSLSERALSGICLAAGAVLLVMGLRAVAAVTLGGAA